MGRAVVIGLAGVGWLVAAACGDGGDTTGPGAGGLGAASTVDGGGGSGADSPGGGDIGGSGGADGGAGGEVPTWGVDCDPADEPAPPLALELVVSGLTQPIWAGSPIGDDERLFIAERAGRISVWREGQLSTYLDLTSKVETMGIEQGLLGVAFHPEYHRNGRLFVQYTEVVTGDSVIEEYRRSMDPDVAIPGPVDTLIRLAQPAANHNGGALEFSPVDGYLYISMGSNGLDGWPEDPLDWYGKIFRIDVSTTPYTNPSGNYPGGLPEVWDIGLRNAWRMGFDACTGDLYIGDVGENEWEEVNAVPAGEGHHDYGWRVMEGKQCSFFAPNCDPAGYTLPVVDYAHDAMICRSVTGGTVYRGNAIPGLRGHYFYGDFCTGQVWTFRWVNGEVLDHVERTEELPVMPYGVSSFGMDNQGEIYILDYKGSVYRVVAAP